MAGSELGFGLCENAFGGRVPFVVPAIRVAGSDAVDGRQDLAELASTVAAGSKCALGLVPELYVVREERIFCVLGHRRLPGFFGTSPLCPAAFSPRSRLCLRMRFGP